MLRQQNIEGGREREETETAVSTETHHLSEDWDFGLEVVFPRLYYQQRKKVPVLQNSDLDLIIALSAVHLTFPRNGQTLEL